MKLQRVALTLFIVVIVFYLLNLGQSLLLPLVIAGAIAYLINILGHTIASLSLRGVSLPRPLAMLVAVSVIVFSISQLIRLITDNVASVIQLAPGYQENLEARIYAAYNLFGFEQSPSLRDILDQIDFRSYLQDFGGTVRALVSSTGIIIVYLLFLLLEQRTFNAKIKALVTQRSEQKDVFSLIERINRDIRTYIGIKVITSAATGLLSYLVLRAVGVDFASFWAVLIFLLNFIPTIGSIIATAFPSILALVQFESFQPFFVTVAVLTSIQFCIGSLIEPRLMGTSLNLSPIVILLSLGLWGSIWGIAGMFLCVPITVIIMIICAYFPESRPIAIALSGNGELPVGPRRG